VCVCVCACARAFPRLPRLPRPSRSLCPWRPRAGISQDSQDSQDLRGTLRSWEGAAVSPANALPRPQIHRGLGTLGVLGIHALPKTVGAQTPRGSWESWESWERLLGWMSVCPFAHTPSARLLCRLSRRSVAAPPPPRASALCGLFAHRGEGGIIPRSKCRRSPSPARLGSLWPVRASGGGGHHPKYQVLTSAPRSCSTRLPRPLTACAVRGQEEPCGGTGRDVQAGCLLPLTSTFCLACVRRAGQQLPPTLPRGPRRVPNAARR
jgi:hypothetical protein